MLNRWWKTEGSILLDSGASTTFVSPQSMKHLAISWTSSIAKLKPADSFAAEEVQEITRCFTKQRANKVGAGS